MNMSKVTRLGAYAESYYNNVEYHCPPLRPNQGTLNTDIAPTESRKRPETSCLHGDSNSDHRQQPEYTCMF